MLLSNLEVQVEACVRACGSQKPDKRDSLQKPGSVIAEEAKK